MADEDEDDAGDEDGEDVADQRPSKADLDFQTCVRSKGGVTHHVMLHDVLGQVFGTNIRQIPFFQLSKMGVLVKVFKLHFTMLCVEGIPLHVKLAKPKGCVFLSYEVLVFQTRIHIGIVHGGNINGDEFVLRIPFNIILFVPFKIQYVIR